MPTAQSSSNTTFGPITGHIAPDILGFYRDGQPDYKRVADVVKLTKEDLSSGSLIIDPEAPGDAKASPGPGPTITKDRRQEVGIRYMRR